MSIFEAMMLICFGAAWPASISKSYRSRSNKGKSFFFIAIVWIGYVSGILHKILFAYDKVIFLYILNLCMVSVDIMLYYRNTRLEKAEAAA
jgi:hypothetical protein